MVSLDAFYQYTSQKIEGLNLKISTTKRDIMTKFKTDEFGDRDKLNIMSKVGTDKDYDFFEDEIIKSISKRTIMELDDHECIRYSIVNIISYCITHIVNDYMVRYSMNTNSYKEGKTCLLDMKNEFLFKNILLTYVKKNYASIQELQEGNIIKGGYMDIKGLAMAKSITNKETQKRLKEIMYKDVLKDAKKFDAVKLIKDLAIFEKEMFIKLSSGDKSMYKPRKIKSMSSYDDPLRIGGMKQALTWNALKDDGVEGFDMNQTNNIDIIDTVINLKTVEKLKDKADIMYKTGDPEKIKSADKYMEKYEKIKDLLVNEKMYKGKINGIAIPADVPTPAWVTEFIDYNTIINSSLSLFPTETLGIPRGNTNNNYTNIVSF